MDKLEQQARTWDVPKRYLRLYVYRQGIKKPLWTMTEETRVQVNTVAAVEGALTEANIVISGLEVKKMFALATNSTQWVRNWVQNRVIVEAGTYDKHCQIFAGTIMEAKPQLINADYTITMKAMSGFFSMTTPASYSFPGPTPVATIAKKVAANNGLTFVDAVKDPSITITDFTAQNHNAVEVLRTLAYAASVDIYEDMGRLIIKKRGESAPVYKKQPITSDMLVGIPEPNQFGCKIQTLLNAGPRLGQTITLDSAKYPEFKKYSMYLQTKSHSIDTFGADWYTTYELVRSGLGFAK